MKLYTKNLFLLILVASLLLSVLITIKQQNLIQNAKAVDTPSQKSKSAPPILNNNELSCSNCRAQGKDTICFNVETNRATCTSSRNITQNINVLCRRCSPQTPKPTCTPRPPCLTQVPRCITESLPPGGWYCAPSITPKPTCIPRPPCLDSNPRCLLEEPANGWCPEPSISLGAGCIPLPPCVKDNRCPQPISEPIAGWCSPTPTPTIKSCLTVLTPARNLTTQQCKVFPNSCIPQGWEIDKTCPIYMKTDK